MIYKKLHRKPKPSNSNLPKNGGELMCFGRVAISFSTCCTRRIVRFKCQRYPHCSSWMSVENWAWSNVFLIKSRSIRQPYSQRINILPSTFPCYALHRKQQYMGLIFVTTCPMKCWNYKYVTKLKLCIVPHCFKKKIILLFNYLWKQ